MFHHKPYVDCEAMAPDFQCFIHNEPPKLIDCVASTIIKSLLMDSFMPMYALRLTSRPFFHLRSKWALNGDNNFTL